VDLYAFIQTQIVHPQIDAPFQQMDDDQVIAFPGKPQQIDLRIPVDPQIVFVAEVDLRPAVTGTKLVSLDQRKIDLALFKTQVSGSLDINIPIDVIQAGVAVSVVAFIFVGTHKGGHHQDHGEKYHLFFHCRLLSPI